MFSKTCEYALRACIYLCIKNAEGKMTDLEEISKEINSPKPFTAKILQQLARYKIITSAKGRNGGFALDDKKVTITLDKIVAVFDGKDTFDRCCIGIPGCGKAKPCPMHDSWKDVSQQIKTIFKTTKLSDLISDKKKLEYVLKR